MTAAVVAGVGASADETEIKQADAWKVHPRSGASFETDLLHNGWNPSQYESEDWSDAEPNDNGWVRSDDLDSGYALATFDSDEDRVMVLHSNGHRRSWFNGVEHIGDVYQHGYVRNPVKLNAGENQLLMYSSKGRARAHLIEPPAEAYVETSDPTLPDLLVGRATDAWAGLRIVNATEEPMTDLGIRTRGEQVDVTLTPLPHIEPLSIRKSPFKIIGDAPDETGETDLTIELVRLRDGAPDEVLHTVEMTLDCFDPTEAHRRTFISEIDGSVQYYGAREAVDGGSDQSPAITVSMHGASVEARGQARSYSPKTWTHTIAPTNRRPFGFDWEGFGRMDAMEVLDVAKSRLDHDPDRIYLTGHSMGGHGAWHAATLYPDQFSAVGVSAGWRQYWTYSSTRRRPKTNNAINHVRHDLYYPSDPEEHAVNLSTLGVYIFHGSEDSSVPVEQAEAMAETLGEFHENWQLQIADGKDHWWRDEYGDGGATCVDWPPMFDFFSANSRPRADMLREVEFVTANPGISSTSHWVTVEAQHEQHLPSRVRVERRPNTGLIKGETDNIARLSLDMSSMITREPLTVKLDEQTIEDVSPRGDGRVYLAQSEDGDWSVASPASASKKGPHRYGPLLESLRQRIIIVYGTAGDDAQTDQARRHARLMADRWWYRGNGAVDVMPDTDFDPEEDPDRDVLLVGDRQTHGHWDALLGDSPIRITPGAIELGDETIEGEDLACMFVQPRPGSETACVVAIGGTGDVGRRQAGRIRVFVPFRRYADFHVLRARDNRTGGRIIATGFFDDDWGLDDGRVAQRGDE